MELIKVIQRSSSEVKKTNLKILMENVSACFDSISNILESSSDIVLGLMEEERENLTGDIKFYFLLAMAMRAKQCTDWFKPDDKGEVENVSYLRLFLININTNLHRSQKTALRIHQCRQWPDGEVLAQSARNV